jgi:hypothetical protein
MEIAASQCACLLAELSGAENWREGWDGYRRGVYGNVTREYLDRLTANLCKRLQDVDVTKHSLEMQVWWRDHQAADKARLEAEQQSLKTEEERRAALAKLSGHERRILGIKD